MAQIDGSTLVARALAQNGVKTLFGLVGGPIVEIMGAAPDAGMRPIGVRHEQAAVFSAAAYGYVSGTVGASVLAAGPGVTNGVTGAHVAWDNSWPVIVLGGSTPQRQRGAMPFQETDNVPMYKPVTKLAIQLDSVERIPEYISMAFRKAVTGRPGPVYLDLPADILNATTDEEAVSWPTNYLTRARPQGDPELVKQASELLLKAERPLMIQGKGVRWSEPYAELRQLVEKLGMPFLPSPMGRGTIPDDHPLNASAARSYSMRNADVVFVIGARMNWMWGMGRGFSPDAKIIHVDIESEEIGWNRGVDVGIVGDCKMVLGQILAELDGNTAGMADRAAEGPWLAALREQIDRNGKTLEPLLASDAAPMNPHRLLREVRDFFPRDTIYTVDGQVILGAGRQVLQSYYPASRLNSGSNGCMGVGVPFAVGAKLAQPGRPVVSVNGDCAFGFNAMELETAARYNLPIIFIVENNQGIVGSNMESRMGLPERYEERVAMYIPHARYDLIAQAFGGHPEYVTTPDELRPALERAYASGKMALINVEVDPDSIFPTPTSGRASALMGH